MNSSQFTERFGNPTNYRFNGKCFDTGTDGKMHCDVCNRVIRYVYIIVKEGQEREKLQVGSCEIATFEQIGHAKLAAALTSAKAYLEVTVEAKEHAIKLYSRRDRKQALLKEWRKIKRQALSQVRKQRQTADYERLGRLFELELIAKKPLPLYKKHGLTVRWLEFQIGEMQTKMAKVV